ncbi:MAG: M23 family metallopeptidase [Melioribacter sp.]|nr:M23 family metallopeptidase [Melioribacter sp.]
MKKVSTQLFFLFLFAQSINAQEIKLIGIAEPGGLLIGTGKNISAVYLNDSRLKVDKNGMFVMGFDRDAAGTQYLKVEFENGKKETKKIQLPKRKYVIQKLKIAEKFVNPPPEELERIEIESKYMKEARSKVGNIDSILFRKGFIKPAEGRISSVFGSQRILNSVPKNPHNGIDIAAPEGTPVLATSDGIVIIAGEDFYYNGNFILLDHGLGLSSIYLHLSKLNVKTGDKVTKGQKIGEVGSTGRSTSAHLHWGVQWYGNRIDPMSLLNISF